MQNSAQAESSTAPRYTAHRIEGLPPQAIYVPDFITEHEEQYLLQKIADSPSPKWKTTPTGRRLQYLGGAMSKNNVLIPQSLPGWITDFPDLINRITSILAEIEAEDAAAAAAAAAAKEDEPAGNGVANGSSTAKGKKPWRPNQVLINEYQSGQGITPHQDGPAYSPLVTTLSLGSPQALEICQFITEGGMDGDAGGAGAAGSPPLVGSSRLAVFGEKGVVAQKEGEGNGKADGEAAVKAGDTAAAKIPESGSRLLATTPIGSLYLEPRSLLIVRKTLYETHMHGIRPVEKDVFSVVKPEGSEVKEEGAEEVEGIMKKIREWHKEFQEANPEKEAKGDGVKTEVKPVSSPDLPADQASGPIPEPITSPPTTTTSATQAPSTAGPPTILLNSTPLTNLPYLSPALRSQLDYLASPDSAATKMDVERTMRVSLTFRQVERVLEGGLRMLGMGGGGLKKK